ncbi:terminase small subunit [Pollutibacter soli]|uniref:terminase small subunit n=1 Tax=Pollutibacter soli TaxID=3034157 RepID=UPI003013F2B0
MSAKKYTNGGDIWAKWLLYKKTCEAGKRKQHASAGKVVTIREPLIPTLGSFLDYLGVSHPTWKSYRTKPAYRNECNQVMEAIQARLERALVNNEGNVSGLKLALSYNYGWKETSAVETNGKLEIKVTYKKGKTTL